LSILQDQHAIAVQPSYHGARRGGTEASGRDARLTFQRRTKRHLELLRQLLTRQNRRWLEGIELTAGVRTDGDDLFEMQIELDLQLNR
jgi:hypothetical protein